MQKTVNKNEAMERLNTIEAEAKKLRAIINASEDITERVQSVEDACRETGKLRLEYIDPYKKAEAEIEIFAEAMREGKPAGECFYYPYFYRSSGGGFSCLVCDDGGRVVSAVGARLRVDTPKKAVHMGKRLIEQYKIMDRG